MSTACGRIGYDDYLTPDSKALEPSSSSSDVMVLPKRDASVDAHASRDATIAGDAAPPRDATHHHDGADAPTRDDVAEAAAPPDTGRDARKGDAAHDAGEDAERDAGKPDAGPIVFDGGVLTIFALPEGAGPWGVTVGNDDAVWFTEVNANKIGRITVDGGLEEFPLMADAGPRGIVAGSDDTVWFAENAVNAIGHMTEDGGLTWYPLGAASPWEVAFASAGTGGNTVSTIYFTVPTGIYIESISPSGVVTQGTPVKGGWGVAPGPMGYMCFTGVGTTTGGAPTIECIDSPTGDGLVDVTLSGPGIEPYGITLGPDGNLWFADFGANAIGTLAVTAVSGGGTMESVATAASLSSNAGPYAITAGPTSSGGASLWFTEYTAGKIARLRVDGGVTEFPLGSSAEPAGIVTSHADSAIWFAAYGGSYIGRFVPH